MEVKRCVTKGGQPQGQGERGMFQGTGFGKEKDEPKKEKITNKILRERWNNEEWL